MFDLSKLSGKIIEVFGTQGAFAKAMNWSERTTSLKMNGGREWKQSDIQQAAILLKIEDYEIPVYFFTPKVQSVELGTCFPKLSKEYLMEKTDTGPEKVG